MGIYSGLLTPLGADVGAGSSCEVPNQGFYDLALVTWRLGRSESSTFLFRGPSLLRSGVSSREVTVVPTIECFPVMRHSVQGGALGVGFTLVC